MRNCKPATCLFGRDPIALAVALACVAPVAVAQPMFGAALNAHADMSDYSENNVEVGVGYNSQDSFKFGEFTGLEEDGAFLILNGNYEQRSADDDRRYWSVSGSNVGLPSRVVEGELGQQGNFSVDARFDQLTRYQYDTTGFIHRGLGGDSLSLPGGFPGLTANNGQPPDNAATIGRYLESYDIKQERDGYELGLKKLFGTDWGLNACYRLEERDGTKLIGSVIGTSGGNPRAVILPRPTEDKTHQLELSADYFGASTQVQLGYYLSLYQPENDSLTWANPFRNTGWTGVVN